MKKRKFEKCVSDCNGLCNHYYVKYKKQNMNHYMLYCTIHGYRTGIDRKIAKSNIDDGAAVCIQKGTEHPSPETFMEFQKEAYEYRKALKRTEAQTSE